MERLTIKNSDGSYSQPTDTTFYEIFNKLGELEDVLEKYGIENLEDFIKEYSSRNIKLANDNYSLEQELAELKQNAMKPEFYIGQDVWCVYKYWWNGKLTSDPDKIAIEKFFIEEIHKNLNGYYYIFRRHSNDGINQPEFNSYGRFNTIGSRNIKEYYLFATQEEAEQKLAEIGGKDE